MTPPLVGDQAPEFTLPDQHGQPVTLSKLRGKKVVVYFYPKAEARGSLHSTSPAFPRS